MSGWLERFGFALGRALRTFRPTASVAAASPVKSIESDPPPESSNLGVFALSDAEMAERKISAITIGELELPTGEIVACDPLITGLSRPAFSRKVEPGRYPVTLFQAQGRIAAAVLRFGSGLPMRWELATFVPDRPPAYKSEFLEFIVDDAVAAFMDKSFLTLMTDTEELDDYLADVACSLDRFGLDNPIEGNPLNVAMFDTGYGDGAYRSFWGLDSAGEPLLLMTDFEVLENADGREGDQAN
ncbi:MULTISPECIES: DUF4241 domain-containing protein [unclassified Mesorhizobium]|uniref:DUF4241 domain-containing protein n=1 Tax=unclassified Mesorhizobium TaxID=325217 RepID=UPI000FCC278E|nr:MULTISPECIES: DUF4241 domain-containing protein [unclassified Mesorhizobium]TGP21998.1 DUF4241 domain-containing protein [Mesorhizobium sp. M1D.F.Ca.ET.231.01.1.1]TGP30383.1 DUF4241 domain-containing protein [Mesorhizobium sp. M1D.F.Ca.ET.234.01.1.1]TGS44459.1 DUF4241 domain-containing protein [Mesorhizobium sp. M1D.F.Ca.ET.184.01.1.1]TGS60499.1 DUF4241 domain-containing protein [Mesorhizobium sp. M1D.F.Ca.ET.183.01.1.1]